MAKGNLGCNKKLRIWRLLYGECFGEEWPIPKFLLAGEWGTGIGGGLGAATGENEGAGAAAVKGSCRNKRVSLGG